MPDLSGKRIYTLSYPRLILILLKLPLDNLFHQVNGYIHVTADLLGTNDISLYRDRQCGDGSG